MPKMSERLVTLVIPKMPMNEALQLREFVKKKFGLESRLSRYQSEAEKRKVKIRRHPHGKPREAKLIKRILQLREKGLTWREIGPKLGMTHQGPYLLYRRWVLGKHWRER